MDWLETAKLAGAVAVPLVAVAGLFLQPVSRIVGPLREEVKATRDEVHAVDVRLARVEEAIRHISPARASDGRA